MQLRTENLNLFTVYSARRVQILQKYKEIYIFEVAI
jgi:hypothetical protein